MVLKKCWHNYEKYDIIILGYKYPEFKLDKNVSLKVSGDDSYLPEKSIAILKESFIHLLTNCVDHGIDKDGDIDVTIEETFDFIKINVRDNGKGINEKAVLKKAI